MPIRFEGPFGIEELIPAPLVDIQKGYVKGPDGRINHTEYTFTLTGTIVNVDTVADSPAAGGYPMTMEGILAEQKRIRLLFSNDGGRLEIETPGGGGPNTIDAYCTIESLTFGQGTWVNRCQYTVVLKSRRIENELDPTQELDSYGESWNVTENEDGTFTLTHNIQAKGALIYTSAGPNDPLDAARAWVISRTYNTSTDGAFTSTTVPPDFDLSNLVNPPDSTTTNYWNKSIVESVDPPNYSWSVTETFIYNPAGNAKEEWSATVNFDNDNTNKTTISLSGSVIGYSDKASNLTERSNNAKEYFFTSVDPNAYTRVTTYVPDGFTVNPVPTAKQRSFELNGTIRYSYTFIGSSGTLIPNAIDENITVNDVGTTDVFAQIQVPRRKNGPVVQNMATVTLPERTISITATIAQSAGITTLESLAAAYGSKPATNDIINALKPSEGYYYLRQDTEEWNPIRKQYSRTVSWVIQSEGKAVSGIPVGPRNPASV